MPTERTKYSQEVPGARANYNWPVRFDNTGGIVGISQFEDGKVKDRVLLSPKQVSELISFARGSRG